MRLRVIRETGGACGSPLRMLPAAVLILALSACGPRPGGSTPTRVDSVTVAPDTSGLSVEEAQRRVDSLAAALEEMVGEAQAEQPEQCRAMPFGAKPCGGPRSYLVYSTASTDPEALARLVEQHREVDAFLNEALGRVSDCMLVTEPPVALEGGRCVRDQP